MTEDDWTNHWRAMQSKAIDWDGYTPVCVWRDDVFFQSADELQEWMDEHNIDIEDVRLVVCRQSIPRSWDAEDLSDLFADYLGLDWEDDGRFDEVIEAMWRLVTPGKHEWAYFATNIPVTLESVKRHLEMET